MVLHLDISNLLEQVLEKLKIMIKESKIEGKDSAEWKLVDGIDLIVHIHPEKRKFYELEKMWSELIQKKVDNMSLRNYNIFIYCLFNYKRFFL